MFLGIGFYPAGHLRNRDWLALRLATKTKYLNVFPSFALVENAKKPEKCEISVPTGPVEFAASNPTRYCSSRPRNFVESCAQNLGDIDP